MYYCNACATKHHLPVSSVKLHRTCRYCHQVHPCTERAEYVQEERHVHVDVAYESPKPSPSSSSSSFSFDSGGGDSGGGGSSSDL